MVLSLQPPSAGLCPTQHRPWSSTRPSWCWALLTTSLTRQHRPSPAGVHAHVPVLSACACPLRQSACTLRHGPVLHMCYLCFFLHPVCTRARPAPPPPPGPAWAVCSLPHMFRRMGMVDGSSWPTQQVPPLMPAPFHGRLRFHAGARTWWTGPCSVRAAPGLRGCPRSTGSAPSQTSPMWSATASCEATPSLCPSLCQHVGKFVRCPASVLRMW